MKGKREKPKRLGEKLLAVRRRLGVSQIKMAQLVNVRQYHRLSEFERSRREPDLIILLAYARAGNVTLESLVDDELDLPE